MKFFNGLVLLILVWCMTIMHFKFSECFAAEIKVSIILYLQCIQISKTADIGHINNDNLFKNYAYIGV